MNWQPIKDSTQGLVIAISWVVGIGLVAIGLIALAQHVLMFCR